MREKIILVAVPILCTGIFLITGQKTVSGALQEPAGDPEMPIEILGEELSLLNMDLADGGLPPILGVQNIQLLRVTRDRPDIAEADGWTYAHHHDLAVWGGRQYAAWGMTPKDEDGLICLIGFIVLYFFLPETKGKTLEDIERELA